MNTTLTPEEREVVLAYAARLEKRSRQWPLLRWFCIASAVFSIGLLLATLRLAARTPSMIKLPPTAVRIMEHEDSKTVASSLKLLASNSEAQVMWLRAEMYLVVKAFIVAAVGAAMAVYAASEWRRDRRDRVFAKLLRSLIASDTRDGG